MRVERVFDWRADAGLVELEPGSVRLEQPLPGALRVGHLSDTHLGKGDNARRLAALRRWLALFIELGVDVMVHTGDLVEDPEDLREVERAFALFEEVGIPVLGVPGNHDVKRPGEGGAVSRRWGPFPRKEVVKGVGIWLLDSMAGLPVAERESWEREAAAEAGFYSRGALGERQLREWERLIRADKSGAELVVLHHHLRQPVPQKPWYEEHDALMEPLLERDRVMDLAGQALASLILHGHRHQYIPPYSPREGILVLNGGSSTPEGPPWRARVVDVGEGGAARIWEVVLWRSIPGT